MKRIAKLMVLLFIAGVMFISCQQNVNIDATEVKLSDGTWDIEITCTGSGDAYGIAYSTNGKENITINVSGDYYTFESYAVEKTDVYIFPEGTPEATISTVLKKLGNDINVTTDGNTVTAKYSKVGSADEIEEMNKNKKRVAEFTSDLPENVEIKTNRKKTEYKLTYTETIDVIGAKASGEYVATAKKR